MDRTKYKSFNGVKASLDNLREDEGDDFYVNEDKLAQLEHDCELIDKIIRALPDCSGMSYDIDDNHRGLVINIFTGYFEDFEIKDELVELIHDSDEVVFEGVDGRTVSVEFFFNGVWGLK